MNHMSENLDSCTARMGTDWNLEGIWRFAYRPDNLISAQQIPAAAAFDACMPVPGFWDDHLASLKRTEVWSRNVLFNESYRKIEYPLGTGKPSDGSLPYLVGTGWYQKNIFIPDIQAQYTLEIAGAVCQIAVYVNRQFVTFHDNPMTPIQANITDFLKPNSNNEVVFAVSNVDRTFSSTAFRGFKGFTGGISGKVTLHIADQVTITDLFITPEKNKRDLHILVELDNRAKEPLCMRFVLRDKENQTVKEVSCDVSGTRCALTCDVGELQYWDDHNPYLYQAEVCIYTGDRLCDRKVQPYGYRWLERDGMAVKLNGRRIFFRGLTEHAYYPLTCTPPMDKESYRSFVKKYREIGFNWIRFHTTVPHENYLAACDELGMMVQVEAPNRYKDEWWTQILYKCRKHPCVVLYCGGNEVKLTDKMIDQLNDASKERLRLAPETLFSPMQGLACVDWFPHSQDTGADDEDNEKDMVQQPILHNGRKLKTLQSFSDVFQPQKDIGFNNLNKTWEELDSIVEFYQRPYMSHEVGILDSFLDFSLENRYIRTRIGTDLYRGAREYLQQEGMLQKAPLYYRNSCLWSAVIRKTYIEKLRLCNHVSGYDYLGAIDCHWHRLGYTPGILNEFHEYKPGENRDDILKYNGENVILLDVGTDCNLLSGETKYYHAVASIYGEKSATDAKLEWSLVSDSAECLFHREISVGEVKNDQNTFLAKIEVSAPISAVNQSCKLKIVLQSREYRIENEYRIWIFADRPVIHKGDVVVCKHIDRGTIQHIANGANVLILNPSGIKKTPLSYHKLMAGRTVGNTATVIADHPALADFPHDGWCDMQFYRMFENGYCAVFDQTAPLQFDPIIEVVNSYKTVIRQSVLFAFQVGRGKAVVCTLNMDGDNPEKRAFLSSILSYMNSNQFVPKQTITVAQAEQFLLGNDFVDLDYDPETGFDGNAK